MEPKRCLAIRRDYWCARRLSLVCSGSDGVFKIEVMGPRVVGSFIQLTHLPAALVTFGAASGHSNQAWQAQAH